MITIYAKAVEVAEGLSIFDLTEYGQGWEVWCGADGDNIINAHPIGTGATRDEAVTKAVAELEQMVAWLQRPA